MKSNSISLAFMKRTRGECFEEMMKNFEEYHQQVLVLCLQYFKVKKSMALILAREAVEKAVKRIKSNTKSWIAFMSSLSAVD